MKISREESYIRMISNSKFNVVWIYGEKKYLPLMISAHRNPSDFIFLNQIDIRPQCEAFFSSMYNLI